MAGRPRKPTHLKVVAGTAQPCRTNQAEPAPQTGVPDAPPHLSERAAAAWAQLSVVVDEMGVLTRSDPVALEMLCNAYVDLLEARASLARPLILSVTVLAEDGGEIQAPPSVMAEAGERYYWTMGKAGPMRRSRPEIADIADAERRVAMWLAKFGLTPADRSRVSAAPKVGANPFSDLG